MREAGEIHVGQAARTTTSVPPGGLQAAQQWGECDAWGMVTHLHGRAVLEEVAAGVAAGSQGHQVGLQRADERKRSEGFVPQLSELLPWLRKAGRHSRSVAAH